MGQVDDETRFEINMEISYKDKTMTILNVQIDHSEVVRILTVLHLPRPHPAHTKSTFKV